jgi:birA, biotin-[acetyl-CoA-carboxylase] ligase region
MQDPGYILNGYGKLDTRIVGNIIYYFEELDSTNSYSKRIASEDIADGTVIIAGSQTNGRGRLGREWFSPLGTGIYLSIILRPDIKPEDLQLITLAVSIAVVDAIIKVTGLRTAIKWPNDILLGNKKICGILTEAIIENDKTRFVIIGIGMNITDKPYDFPQELAEKAAYILADRNTMLAEVLREMDCIYSLMLSGRNTTIIEKWKEYSATIGREICITSDVEKYTGVAVDITNKGELVVACHNDLNKIIQSGEISIRGIMGYI